MENISILNLGLLLPSGIEILRLKNHHQQPIGPIFVSPFLFGRCSASYLGVKKITAWLRVNQSLGMVNENPAKWRLITRIWGLSTNMLTKRHCTANMTWPLQDKGCWHQEKLNSDGYTPRKWTNVPLKKRPGSIGNTSEPTIDFQRTCISFCGVFPLLLFLMDHFSFKKNPSKFAKMHELGKFGYI